MQWRSTTSFQNKYLSMHKHPPTTHYILSFWKSNYRIQLNGFMVSQRIFISLYAIVGKTIYVCICICIYEFQFELRISITHDAFIIIHTEIA